MEATLKAPMSQRFNLRMLVFTVVVLGLIGYPVYQFVDQKIHGGIWKARDSRGEYLEVDLKTLSGFEMDQVRASNDDIPKDFRALDGKRIALIGEMYNDKSTGGAQRDFDLVYSIQKCCFSGPPKIQHFIRCKAEPGKRIDYYGGTV